MEIEELHAFFQAWFAGAVPDDEAHFGRFSSTLSPDFTIIPPSGNIIDSTTIQHRLRDAYGTSNTQIWIEKASARRLGGQHIVAVYEEWQRRDGVTSVRQSSAIFSRSQQAPNGVIWQHVHETWIANAAS